MLQPRRARHVPTQVGLDFLRRHLPVPVHVPLAIQGIQKMMREQAVARLLVPTRNLIGLRGRHRRHLALQTSRLRRVNTHRTRGRHQRSPVTRARETRVQIHLHAPRVRETPQLFVQKIERISFLLRRARRHVHREEITLPVGQARHPVPRIVDHYVPLPLRKQFRPQVAHLVLPAPEGIEHLRARGVAKIDDVPGIETEHLHDVALEGVRVPMSERNVGNVGVSVVPVAHDHRNAIRVANHCRDSPDPHAPRLFRVTAPRVGRQVIPI